eukprot:TRINITY_DN6087_c0_g1_i1.p1 TRINITY_DN6087_c0_g1~~TRINITY_DN6087_c0_g1_i1.p1  ORF type:complete len:201 (+),score=18.88 TRINITY_DN6087_c0_g1_i1:228-830(+)
MSLLWGNYSSVGLFIRNLGSHLHFLPIHFSTIGVCVSCLKSQDIKHQALYDLSVNSFDTQFQICENCSKLVNFDEEISFDKGSVEHQIYFLSTGKYLLLSFEMVDTPFQMYFNTKSQDLFTHSELVTKWMAVVCVEFNGTDHFYLTWRQPWEVNGNEYYYKYDSMCQTSHIKKILGGSTNTEDCCLQTNALSNRIFQKTK